MALAQGGSDIDELVRALADRRVILFAGAGLSMSVGLPSWGELVRHMASELDLDPDPYEASGAYQTLAEYYRLKQGSIGPLRSWMDRNWRVSEEQVRNSRLHQLIMELKFPIIYTTNYDRNIEAAFEVHGQPYVKVANARDIAKPRDDKMRDDKMPEDLSPEDLPSEDLPSEDLPQVVKFHGDFDDDESLVVTETDYFNRLSFDTPLDIKFRADAQAKTLLFVGYSMTDLNIRLLLHKLWRTWLLSGYERDRPPSFVFMSRTDPVQEAVLGQWGLKLLHGAGEDPQTALTLFLEDIAKRVSQMRETSQLPSKHPELPVK